MKTLVLAEKPSVGRELARVLGCADKTKTHIEGKEYIVTWAMGHLIEPADPEAYDGRWATWSLDYLPMLPERLKYRVIGRTGGQFRAIKGLFYRKDVDHLVVATDAGREGEMVARLIMRLGGWKGKTSRLWISSQTDTAIREGFAALRPGRDYENLFHAAESRTAADWIIGLNLSRALSCKHEVRLSAGRVQTPTLAMIARREEEIRSFVPRAFWNLYADFGDFKALWFAEDGNTRFFSRDKAETAAALPPGTRGRVVEAGAKEKRESPPKLYDLTALQREANASLGFSAKRTLDILQTLYERHKVVSYPRTDSRYITPDIVPTLPSRLAALKGTPFRKHVETLLAAGVKPGKAVVNPQGVSDHHALIPTEEPVDLSRFSPEERALWDMVIRRFIETLMGDFRYSVTTLVLEVTGTRFKARSRTTLDQGWRVLGGGTGAAEESEADTSVSLDRYKRGDELTVVGTELKEGRTKPPPRHTEGTLLEAMENPGKFVDDPELRKSISRCGLGTPATRAEIIEKLLKHYYAERKGKELHMTGRGLELLDLVPEDMKSPALTARWEHRLQAIERDEEKPADFDRDIRRQAEDLVRQVKEGRKTYTPRGTGKPCPLCGRPMTVGLDKKGRKVAVCHALTCGYEEAAEETGRDFMRKPTGREKAVARKLIQKYSDQTKETVTFADLMKEALNRKMEQGEKKS